MTGLMVYLAGPGRSNEHENPHVVAGDDVALATVAEGKELDRDDAVALAQTLDHPRRMYGREVTTPIRRYDPDQGKRVKIGEKDAHVWHCSLSLSADADEALTDAAWKMLAEQFVERMGFIDPDGAKSSRWVAVRHGLSKNGNDHIHVAVQMVTEDGSRAREHNDRSRAQKVCRQLEREFGLAITEGAAMKQTLPHEKSWERERKQRERAPFLERKELRRRVRAAAAGATSEAEFVQRVYSSGVILRPRFAGGSTDRVTGYSVALPPPKGTEREPIFYSPAKHLDKNLSLPKVRSSLGLSKEGDPSAVGAWQEHHSATRESVPAQTLAPPAEALRNRLAAGTVSVADLSRIYASASIHFEKTDHGPLAEASEQIAAVATNPMQAGHSAKLMDRALSRDSIEGWTALMRQAMKLSQAMSRDRFGGGRVQLSATHDRVLAEATQRHDTTTATATLERPTPASERGQGGGTSMSARERLFGVRGTAPRAPSRPTTRNDQQARDSSRTRDDGVER
ncbi:hypothetical protein GCM10023159_17960 [Brevibacterium yomogidense]